MPNLKQLLKGLLLCSVLMRGMVMAGTRPGSAQKAPSTYVFTRRETEAEKVAREKAQKTAAKWSEEQTTLSAGSSLLRPTTPRPGSAQKPPTSSSMRYGGGALPPMGPAAPRMTFPKQTPSSPQTTASPRPKTPAANNPTNTKDVFLTLNAIAKTQTDISKLNTRHLGYKAEKNDLENTLSDLKKEISPDAIQKTGEQIKINSAEDAKNTHMQIVGPLKNQIKLLNLNANDPISNKVKEVEAKWTEAAAAVGVNPPSPSTWSY